MTVLVTGSNGFIGTPLVAELRKRGERVATLDRHPPADLVAGVRYIPSSFKERLPNLQQIYHLACPASPVQYGENPLDTFQTAVGGTAAMLELAVATNSRLLLASTSEVYGDPLVHPQREDYWGNVDCRGVRACYDEGKRGGETLVALYQGRVETRTARIFNTYGPGMSLADGRVISTFINALRQDLPLPLISPGRQTRSFCYISDMVEGLVRLMNSTVADPVNLGNPEEITIRDLALVLQEVSGRRISLQYLPAREGEPMQRCPDIQRAAELLGWRPTVELRAGLKETWRRAVGS